jgi:multisubunit Na+/H+ antiporter MnhF subunit
MVAEVERNLSLLATYSSCGGCGVCVFGVALAGLSIAVSWTFCHVCSVCACCVSCRVVAVQTVGSIICCFIIILTVALCESTLVSVVVVLQ